SMEYMSKGTLTRRLNNLSIIDALKTAVLVTDALYYGRMNRLAHRWVTPDNIYFDDNEIPKLGNWRTASITQKLYKNPNLNDIVTVYYPPEKVASGQGGLDYFSDIYQMGAVLFTMLTGKPIFNETGEALIEKIKNGHAHAANFHNPDISLELDKVIKLCLAKNKKDRYQSTAALKNDLLKILASYESARKTT
ncbi:MAG TPA: protein kinase, partial [Dehalococcoidales bacterium]|nr:protein kinase [Dehalococcoidales bacterium]